MNSTRTFAFVTVLLAFLSPAAALAGEGGGAPDLPLPSVLPFVLLLACIAVLPLVVPHWWEKNGNKAIVSAAMGVPLAIWLVAAYGHVGAHELFIAGKDYASFIALLGALFVISGGIYIKGSLAGTPLSNTAILGIGAILANVIGTTGASMVLIRPFLRANERRMRKSHAVIFFIFVVSNCGGLLTPLGDPPLFLGFLKGVPFEWTLRLWRQWLFMNGALLVVFNLVDQYMLDREEKEREGSQLEEVMVHEPLRLRGWHNLFFLGGVVLVVLGKGQGWGMGGDEWPFGLQEGLMAALAVAAYASTRTEIRSSNRFSFAPIVEVAVLFAGIFVTMVAPLLILNKLGQTKALVITQSWHIHINVTQPWQFFWAAGALSSFLDNAPTYMTFAATACGTQGVGVEGSRYLADFLARGSEAAMLLAAVSCGAVFMGANTYIGNGPNFMVKAIAEESGVKMPSFFGYMAWSVGILIPLFVVCTFIFFV
ncbi:MAG: sodium:proton antiporter [Planctomycetota bacterium]